MRHRALKTFVAALSVVTASGCWGFSNAMVENHGNALPPDMHVPSLSGDVNNSADQICQWVDESQQPFPEPLIDDAYVETIVGYEAWALLNVFLQHEPQTRLVLQMTETEQWQRQTGSESVYALVTSPGLWSFRKTEMERCDRRDAQVAVSTYNDTIRLCVEVERLDSPPPEAWRVDYRNLYYTVSIGALRQLVAVRVVTAFEDGKIQGRHVAARLFAGPLDVGRIRRSCAQPNPDPLSVFN